MSNKLKIGIIVDELAPGSAPKLVGWPIREMRRLGISCEAIIIARKSFHVEHKEIYNFHLGGIELRYITDFFPSLIRKLNFTFPGMSFFSLHHIASYFYASRAVKKGEFDMIISHCQYSTFASRNIQSKHQIPFITLLWDPSTFTAKKIYKRRFGPLYPLLYSAAVFLDYFSLSKCEALITSGTFHHQSLRKLTSKKLNILYPGCFPVKTLPSFKTRQKIIISFDRWDIGNDPQVLLEIMSRVKNKDASMLIGGFWHPKTMLEEFKAKIDEYNLSGRVKIMGPLNEADIIKHCSKARVHLHPIHEAFGMQTLEASACGCPSIVPFGSGVCEIFEDKISGFHPEPKNFELMAHYCDFLLDNDQEWKRMSNAAYKAAKKHDWSAHAKQIISIVRQALADQTI